jgi:hypothetical protein
MTVTQGSTPSVKCGQESDTIRMIIECRCRESTASKTVRVGTNYPSSKQVATSTTYL